MSFQFALGRANRKADSQCWPVASCVIYICAADCFWLLDALLEYTVHGNMPPVLEERRSPATELDSSHIPLSRREGCQFCPCVIMQHS